MPPAARTLLKALWTVGLLALAPAPASAQAFLPCGTVSLRQEVPGAPVEERAVPIPCENVSLRDGVLRFGPWHYGDGLGLTVPVHRAGARRAVAADGSVAIWYARGTVAADRRAGQDVVPVAPGDGWVRVTRVAGGRVEGEFEARVVVDGRSVRLTGRFDIEAR